MNESYYRASAPRGNAVSDVLRRARGPRQRARNVGARIASAFSPVVAGEERLFSCLHARVVSPSRGRPICNRSGRMPNSRRVAARIDRRTPGAIEDLPGSLHPRFGVHSWKSRFSSSALVPLA